MNVAYLCLGGNMGNREVALKTAINTINDLAGKVVSLSNIYETEAWGVTNQQAYLNQCISIETKLNSNELINTLLGIEKDLGRVRNLYHTYEPRTIDIDILFFNHDIINTENLIAPHPRLHLRKFVLVPLAEIASNYIHPALNKTINDLLKECPDKSEVKLFNHL